MYLTGFADEAADDIAGQISATKKLGWNYIEARNVNGQNIHDLSQTEFEAVCEKLDQADVKINCFGSAIANWATQITDSFDCSLQQARRAIPRMQQLGTKLVRVMSFAVLAQCEPDDQMEEERFRRLRELTVMFTDAGITTLHENCMNYGGMGWLYTIKLIENVPGLKLVFDTGNPVFLDDRTKPKPYPKQSSWKFYSHVKEHVEYVHVKDCTWDASREDAIYTFPGEGDGDVKRILKDLSENRYSGGISIEPHLASVFHDQSVKSDKESRYSPYVEYGRRLMKLLTEIGFE